jgi:hypothetical protein
MPALSLNYLRTTGELNDNDCLKEINPFISSKFSKPGA